MVSKNRYSLYIGRFQPFHNGHEWCVRQMLDKGKRICIAIMDIHSTEPENNPYQSSRVIQLISDRFVGEIEAGDIKVIKIPPIESVNYGRDVGYDLNELIPPDDIKEISATRIRNEL